MTSGENLVLCDAIVTRVAGYRFHATAPPTPGAMVQFIREPENRWDANAIAVCDADARRLGYLFRELAEEYAALVDCGCVRLAGRLAAPGDPDFDGDRLHTNPVLIVWVYVDPVRLDAIYPGPSATSQPPVGLVDSTATTEC